MDKTRFGHCVLHVAHDTFLLSGCIGVSLMQEKHTKFSGFYMTLFKINDHPTEMDISIYSVVIVLINKDLKTLYNFIRAI